MKASHVVILSAVLGSALGVGISWANFHDSPPLTTGARVGELGVSPSAPAQGRPKAAVDEPDFDFGAIERGTKAVHVFRVTNLGDAPLTLKAGGTSCSRCTIAELGKTRLDPGETADVKLEYLTTRAQPRFRQHASIVTNDPEQPRLDLTISGVLTSRYRVVPDDLVLSKISANETKTAEIKVYSYLTDEVGVENYEFTGKSSAPSFEAAIQPIPREQLNEPEVRSGCRVLVTVKPGLPLGPFRQTIRLELKMPGATPNPVIEVPIEGTIDSDISIVGRGWNSDLGRLSIGDVKSSEGAHRDLLFVVRGPYRHDVVIKPASADPSWLKVTVGEPTDLKTGAGGVTQIPLSIEIPPGVPPVNHLGSEQGKYAEVILETTHSDVQQIRMYLQFLVEP